MADPYRALYDTSGSQLAYNDDAGTSKDSLVTYTPGSSGTYYAEAKDYGGGGGAYSISASESSPSSGRTSEFSITINYSGNSAYQSYFSQAAQRWAQIITGDLPDVNSSRGLIDDLLIDASVDAIDGLGGILGQAAATAIRSGGLPFFGRMKFDAADVAQMITSGVFGYVVLHEMGHVLGLSSYMWQLDGLVSSSDPYAYTGAHALAAYDSLVQGTPTSVPLETEGGAGTARTHWSEDVFGEELMTGYAEAAPPMPISIITVGVLQDLGYQVNYAAADFFSL